MSKVYTTHNGYRMASLLLIAVLGSFAGCNEDKANYSIYQSEMNSLRAQVVQLTAANEAIKQNLITFDTLEYTVFTTQQWSRLHESHSKDIKVNWPDGHFTTGIDQHIADLKAMFAYAPNTSIKQHPVRFGSGDMTCVTGIMTGTFTRPMPLGMGKLIQPTGKSFSLPMCTIGIWKDGVMTEKFIYWDNQSYLNQIGLGE